MFIFEARVNTNVFAEFYSAVDLRMRTSITQRTRFCCGRH